MNSNFFFQIFDNRSVFSCDSSLPTKFYDFCQRKFYNT